MSELKHFLGMCTYYQEFVKHCAQPLYGLLGKSSAFVFLWLTEPQITLNDLKLMLTSVSVLQRPHTSLQYIRHVN